MIRRLLPLLALASCLAPATAVAEVSDFGSDLSSPANIDLNHGADTSYWNQGQGVYHAPAEGQVTVVKLKGGVLPNERLRNSEAEKLAQIIHFQVLREKGDGTLKVVALSTGHLEIPIADEKQAQELVTGYKPVNLCVKKGDIVAFNTIGAHEYRRNPGTLGGPEGAQYQVFGRVPTGLTAWYEKDNGLNEGTTIDPSPFQPYGGVELLMRTTLATGPDSTDICPGGYAQHIFRGLEFKEVEQPTVFAKRGIARVKGFCHGENYGGCFGTVALDATLDGVPTRLGEVKLSIQNSHTETIDIPLSPESVIKLQRAQKVTATATADAHDNPRADDRVKWDSVPVQSKTTTEEVVLTPDLLPCVVPKLVKKSSKSAKSALRAAGCATKTKYKKAKKRSQVGKVIAQNRPAGTVLPSGTAITITIGRSK
ncbi:MAG: PASTA domain-containing protein [Actinomycetota bacterium]|nr:PASTA domain-containing protein [Actinomycetota bacterium]